jgi:four helix bundle protein
MNDEGKQDLRKRTKAFALRIVRLYTSLPKTGEAQVIGKQLLRSGTSVGAHYHESYRARSAAEFISKIGGGQQELEESIHWMELLTGAEIIPAERLAELQSEADELMAIFASSIITAKKNNKK